MYYHLFKFEMNYLLRRPVFYLGWLLIMAATVLLVYLRLIYATEASAVIKLNHPVPVAQLLSWLQIVTLFLPVMLIGNVILRDPNTKMEELVKASPVNYPLLQTIRFLASLVPLAVMYMSLAVVIEGVMQLFGQTEFVAPFNYSNYVWTYSLLLLPNIFIFAALLFTVISWSGSIMSGYLVFVAVFIVSQSLGGLNTGGISQLLCSLFDPGATCVLKQDVSYWTHADYQNKGIQLSQNMLINRIFWAGGAFILLVTTILFKSRELRAGKATKFKPVIHSVAQLDIPLIPIQPGSEGAFRQYLFRFGYETKMMLRSWMMPIMLLLLAAMSVLTLMVPEEDINKAFYPIASFIAPRITEGALFAGLIMILFLAGETVWREKKNHISELLYATPASSAVFYWAKFSALAVAAMICTIAMILSGITYEYFVGPGTGIRAEIYIVTGIFELFIPLLMLSIFAIFIQTLAPGKAVGYIILSAWIVLEITTFQLGYEDFLYHIGAISQLTVSEMNGFGHYLNAPLWFIVYWGSIHLLLGLITLHIWRRSLNTPLKARIKDGWNRLTAIPASAAVICILVAICSGGYIFWNTHILNEYVTANRFEKMRADYEKAFAKDANTPGPSVTDVDLEIDLDTQKRHLNAKGTMTLENKTDQPIKTVRVQFGLYIEVKKVIMPEAQLVSRKPRFNDYLFSLNKALQPGENIKLSFSIFGHEAGFEHRTASTPSAINDNGTSILNNIFVPKIGIDTHNFLDDDARRKAYGLPSLGTATIKKYHTQNRSLYTSDSSGINLKLTVSTNKDQVILAPGVLKKEWMENNKRHFRFETDHPIKNQWNLFAGRYKIHRAKWKDINLAMYYDAKQENKSGRVIYAFRKSLDYLTQNFGPYQYKQLSMAVYPYGVPAISYPGTIAYPEGSYIISTNKATGADILSYVTSHEVSHQWWGHQLAPANMPGAKFLSETLSEYSALMVMEKMYGKNRIRRYLQRDLERYLRYRSTDSGERPLATVENHQDHIAYHKGALAMYALREAIGEEAVNSALRTFLEKFRFKGAPYPKAHDLLDLLKVEAGPEHGELIEDLFEKITFWEFATTSAIALRTSDGKWKVSASFSANKFEAGSYGNLSPRSINNKVDIGLFLRDPSDPTFSSEDVILLKKYSINKSSVTVDLVAEKRPLYIGINPYLKFMEQKTEDNIIPIN